MHVIIALGVLLAVETYVKRFVLKMPVKFHHEVVKQARESGFLAAAVDAPVAKVIACAAAVSYGMAVGHWWVGFAAIGVEVALTALFWWMLVREVKSTTK